MTKMKSETQAVQYTITNDDDNNAHLPEGIVKCKLPSEKDDNHEYNPYDHGNTKHPIEYCGAVVHLVRSTIGTGILVLPFAFHRVGYGIGIVGTLLVGLLYVSNVHALLYTEYQLCRRLKVRNLSFVGVVEHSFELGPQPTRCLGPYFKWLLYLYYGLPSGCAVYLIVVADNVRHICRYFFAVDLGLVASISAVLLPVMLLTLIPKLKFLVPLSIVTNVFTAANIAIILLYSFDLAAWRRNAHLVEDVRQVPKFFAIMLQSLIATGMVLPLKNDMRRPQSFASTAGVLNVSFVLLTLLFGTFGLVGYLNYGAEVQDNVLSNLPADDWLTVLVYILYTLALCVTYTLLFYVYYDTVWTNFVQDRVAKTAGYAKPAEYAVRLCVNLLAYLMAVAVPNFSLFTSIVGTVGIIIEIGLPSTLQLLVVLAAVKVKPAVFRYYCLVKNVLIILIAVIMFNMSFSSCVQDVIELYKSS